MLQHPRVTAFTVLELLRQNQLGGVKLPPPTQIRPSPPTSKLYGPMPPTPKFQLMPPISPTPKYDPRIRYPHHPLTHAICATQRYSPDSKEKSKTNEKIQRQSRSEVSFYLRILQNSQELQMV